jgi:hypothetical protein
MQAALHAIFQQAVIHTHLTTKTIFVNMESKAEAVFF